MSGKFALIIGNTEYTDPGLTQLTAPGKDAEDFARVLKEPEICAFDDVSLVLNQPEYIVRGAIDEFYDQKKPDDLLVLYFSGHGMRDELGSLYLVVQNTIRTRLRSTAIKSDYIREAMDQSRSKRQVLILDCCNSGAFEQGTKAATGVSIGTATAFDVGYGRIILTASDSTQFAWEGDKVIGETDNSLFTHFLVQGLEGEADLDSDGRITVDELYDYAYDKVKLVTPKQTPSKFSSKQQGEIVLRQNIRMEDIKPATLPAALLDSLENPFPDVRLGTVQQLIKLLNGKNLALARSTREVLEKVEAEDDSRTVSRAASQALEPIRQAEQLAIQKAEEERLAAEKVEAERSAKLKAEEERLAAEQKAEAERKAKREARRLAAANAKEERLACGKVEAERKAKEESEQQASELAPGEVTIEKAEKEYAREKTGRYITNVDMNVGEEHGAGIPKPTFLFNLGRKRSKLIFVGIGLITVVIGLWVTLPHLIFWSTNEASTTLEPYHTPSVTIRKMDSGFSKAFLTGILFELEVQTNRDQPQEVVVYLVHDDGRKLVTVRTLTNMLSPYIAMDGQVAVYENIDPSSKPSVWKVSLFIPNLAIAEGDLSDGDTTLRAYAELHNKANNDLIDRSGPIRFTYTR
jgi:hypothetical protein